MRRNPFPALVVLAAFVACDTGDTDLETEPAAEQPAPVVTPEPSPQPAPSETGSALSFGVDSLDAGQAYLTDGTGRAVYLLENEKDGGATCEAECLQEWPPVLATNGDPSASVPSIQEGQFGTIDRDGQQQVTYNGHPLYYYHDDTSAGQTSGHEVHDDWGGWYLVTPAGEALGEGQE